MKTMDDGRFLRACRRQEVDCTPVWFMRQAGRYLEEYRKVREKHTLLEICKTPELAAEVTLQPIRRFHVDAAIIFADILLPLEGMGVGFEFARGEGPVVHQPIRTPADVDALHEPDYEKALGSVFEAIRLVRQELDSRIALIGFAGAPFTVASYMIEGGYSRAFLHTKLMMYRYPESWHQLMHRLASVTFEYLKRQIAAGAQAIQLFDSWVGCLSPGDYRRFVLPYSKTIFEGLKTFSVPMIHFGTGTSTLLEEMKKAGGTVIGIDWRIELREAWSRLGEGIALQGNLDPVALLGPRERLKEKVEEILSQADGRCGHIFNLGHGLLPQTPVDHVDAVVQWVHELTRR